MGHFLMKSVFCFCLFSLFLASLANAQPKRLDDWNNAKTLVSRSFVGFLQIDFHYPDSGYRGGWFIKTEGRVNWVGDQVISLEVRNFDDYSQSCYLNSQLEREAGRKALGEYVVNFHETGHSVFLEIRRESVLCLLDKRNFFARVFTLFMLPPTSVYMRTDQLEDYLSWKARKRTSIAKLIKGND